jgi:hypothetical protein
MSGEKDSKRKTSVSRYPGQRILIGDSIVIRISKVEGKRVFVYIEGPIDLKVVRPDKDSDQRDRALGKSAFDFGDPDTD